MITVICYQLLWICDSQSMCIFTLDADVEVKEEFYSDLHSILYRISMHDNIIVG